MTLTRNKDKIPTAKIKQNRLDRMKWLIPDKGMRDLILEYGEDLSDEKSYLDYFKNILYLSNMIIYKKFTEFKARLQSFSSDERKEKINAFPNAFVRIYNLLDECYTSGKLEFQIIEDIILNLQIDASVNEKNGFIKSLGLQKFFYFPYIGNKLSKYIFSLKKSIISSKQQTDFTFDDLDACIQAFPFLHNGKIKHRSFYGSESLTTISLEHCGEEIDLDELILVIDEQSYFLDSLVVNDARKFDEDAHKEQNIMAEYSVPLARGNLHVQFFDRPQKQFVSEGKRHYQVFGETLIEDILLKFRLTNTQRNNNEGILWQYSFIDNKYIKYLALSIADCLSSEGKRILYDKFCNQYSDVFTQFNQDGIVHWDEILIFLLLEVGIYKLLYFLFKNTNLNYDEIVAKFRSRFGENVSKLEDQYELIRDPLSVSALRNDEEKIHSRVQALILLARKLLTANEIDISYSNGMGALSEIRDNIGYGYKNNILSDEEKILFLSNQLINLNNFIFVFYKSLLKFFAKEKNQEFEVAESSFLQGIRGWKDEAIRFEEVRKSTLQSRRQIYDKYSRLIQIKNLDVDALRDLIEMVDMSFEDIKKLNDEISARNSSSNIYFYDMTGRNKLFHQEDFDSVRCGILEALKEVTEHRNIDSFYFAIERYIGYLMDGTLDQETDIKGAIYPLMGVCSSSVISRDGYRYSYLSALNGKEKGRMEIKIISDIAMKTGELYYCVPNIKRCFYSKSNEHRIWMNPQLIPYLAYMPNTKATFEKLESKADYEETAHLIFLSDKELYEKLFGNQDNAVKILSQLFDAKGSLFYKEYVRFLRLPPDSDQRGQIVAVATFYSEMPKWDSDMNDIMEAAFRIAQIELPPTYAAACASLKDTFTETIGSNYYVSDLCVHEDFRGKGYAKHLLNCLIKIAEKEFGKNLVLAVYENNTAALGLYNLMGFISYVSSYDNHGKSKGHQEKYYKMIKYI